jgi:hypothetical protein
MKIKNEFKSRGEAALYLFKRGWRCYTTAAGIVYLNENVGGQRQIERVKPGLWRITT